jgi:hypothetical protein
MSNIRAARAAPLRYYLVAGSPLDYNVAIRFFVDVLEFELVEDTVADQ